MSGEQSVRSDEASDFRKVLERTTPNTSSFRSELLSDRDDHKAHKVKAHKSSSHRRHRSRQDRDRVTGDDVLEARQLSRLLAHDEIEATEMRRVLIKTSERLDQETRRANDAEIRAREAEARILTMQIAKQKAQGEAMRDQEAIKAYHAQLEVARNEIKRAQKELDSMAADRERAQEEAAKDRSSARAMAKQIEIQKALEQGRQEGKIQGFVDGRKEGWYIGTRDGKREALKELLSYDDAASVSSASSVTPPPATTGNPARVTSFASTASHSAAPPPPAPVDNPLPANPSQITPRATSTRTATHADHKRSGSFTAFTPRLRRSSDSKPAATSKGKTADITPTPVQRLPSSERLADRSRSPQTAPSTSRDPGRVSPALSARFNAPPSPRPTQTSPLGLIPLQENGRVALPPPHVIDPPPPSPHSPAIPLPPEIPYDGLLGLQPPNMAGNSAPMITVQEPTPPEPPVAMPEPHPAPASSGSPVENNVKPSRVLARDYAFDSRPESPPLPPLPTERGAKGQQRQRQFRTRVSGLHAPGRSSPSDTSTEISAFDIVTANGMTEQQERARLALARGNGSTLSVIMEGGSTVAESPEPGPSTGARQQGTPRLGGSSSLSHNGVDEVPRPPSTQGILHDPREYGDLPEAQLSPSQLAQRQAIADQLRWTPTQGDVEATNGMRHRDDVSIKSTTTRASASAPRRRPNVRMPERLGPSRAVEVLEKQAEMYDAFGTGHFPQFDRQSSSSPDDAVSTRTPPDFRKGHRRAVSSATTVPDITIQPPSRSSSHVSKVSTTNFSPLPGSVTMPVPGTPSRRYSMPEPQMTPSMVPLPQTTVQAPMTLHTPFHGEFTLPPGFVPAQGPPEGAEQVSSFTSKSPGVNTVTMSTKTPRTTNVMMGGPPGFLGNTPAGIPLPMSTATTSRGLPDTAPSSRRRSMTGGPPHFPGTTPAGIPLPLSTTTTHRGLPDMAPSGSRRSSQPPPFDLPNVAAMSYEPAPLPPGMQYPASFGPTRIPLPESIIGNSPRTSIANQVPWGASSGYGAGATPGISMPSVLGSDRPMAMYAGDGGANKKVSSVSLSSLHKKVEPSAYLDPTVLASTDSATRHDVDDGDTRIFPHAGSVRSSSSVRDGQKSPYAASVETVTDEDDSPSPHDP